jgi:hypothetical protein
MDVTSPLFAPTVADMKAAILPDLQALVPQPATTMPPGVADTGGIGDRQEYARANHTHASKARKQRVLNVGTSTYKWTYPTAFPDGVIPIVNGIVEDPANRATDCYNVQIVGPVSNTDCTFRIVRQSTGLLSLLLGALSINPTAGTVNLHCLALEP